MEIKNIRQNFFGLNTKEYIETNNKNLKLLAEILNNKKLVILTGMKNIGKLNFIKEFLNKSGIQSNYFYFNKNNDYNNLIQNEKDLNNLLNDYVQLYKIPKIIILDNISNIEGVKGFISNIYKLNYKIILISNNIKISGIKEIEIQNNPKLSINNIDNIIKYGSLNETRLIKIKYLKEKILKLITNDIFLNDIFLNNSVKNIELYNSTITFIAQNNFFSSLRELQKELYKIYGISLKTLIDYIDYSIQSKIIKKVYKYDLKTNNTITSKVKYYFTDNGVRNSLIDFKLNKDILIENLIFDKLYFNNFKIFSGINGKFNFTFYALKTDSTFQNHTTKIFIHISDKKSKEDIQKEVSKLIKIGIEGKKYLLAENLEKLKIKKTEYNEVKIIEINDFLINYL